MKGALAILRPLRRLRILRVIGGEQLGISRELAASLGMTNFDTASFAKNRKKCIVSPSSTRRRCCRPRRHGHGVPSEYPCHLLHREVWHDATSFLFRRAPRPAVNEHNTTTACTTLFFAHRISSLTTWQPSRDDAEHDRKWILCGETFDARCSLLYSGLFSIAVCRLTRICRTERQEPPDFISIPSCESYPFVVWVLYFS